MADTLEPKNFRHIPLFYRPQKKIRVSKNFGKKVRGIRNQGGRADDEDIADVMTVLEDMRTYTPKIFKIRKIKTRASKGKKMNKKGKRMTRRRN